MRNKLLLAILVFMLTGLVNAFAAIPTKSQIYPLNGTIVNTVQQVCNADVSSPVPSGVPSTFFKNEIVQATFVPEPTLGFTAWVSSLTTKSIASPVSQIGTTQDPTSSTPLMLVETPIQWGQSNQTQKHLAPAPSKLLASHQHHPSNHSSGWPTQSR